MQGWRSELMSSIIAAKFMCILTSLRRAQSGYNIEPRPRYGHAPITAAIRVLIERASLPRASRLMLQAGIDSMTHTKYTCVCFISYVGSEREMESAVCPAA